MESIISNGLHEAVIDEETFAKCLQIRKSQQSIKNTKQNTKKVYLLAGIIKCDYCGRNLRAQSAGNGTRYYRDTSKSRGFYDCIVDNDSKKSINADDIEAQLVGIINKLVLPKSWESEVQKIYDSELQKSNSNSDKKASIRAEIKRMRKNYELGLYEEDELDYERRISLLKEKLMSLEIPSNNSIKQASEIIVNIKDTWIIATECEREKIVKMVFKEIGASIKTGKITWFIPQFGFEPLFRLISNVVIDKDHRFKIIDCTKDIH